VRIFRRELLDKLGLDHAVSPPPGVMATGPP
jgi:hypothetical protein